MLKRILAFALLAVLLLGLIAPVARATEETAAATEAAEEEKLEGWLDDHFRWELVDGTLTITGEGVMPGRAPWKDYADQVENLFFDGNIYTVQAGAFRDCRNLKEIQFSSALSEIGEYAFAGCTSIEEIRLPHTFRRFGTMSFAGCDSLETVYCEGYMPRFEESCLWNGGKIQIFFSPEKPWGEEDVKVLEHNFGGRLEVLCTDGTDPTPAEGEEAQPEKVEQTVPPATEVPTVPTTAATEPPTVPETTVPETTVPETMVPETTVPEVILEETVPQPTVQLAAPTEEAPQIEEETVKDGFLGLALIVGVLTFFIVGALVFKIRSRGGRY